MIATLKPETPKHHGNAALLNGQGLFWVIFAYAAVHSVLRLSFSGNFTTDDAGAALNAQTWQLAYSIYQPPLYEWCLWLAQKFFGYSMVATLAVKYTAIGLSAFFLYQSALLAMQSRRFAALTVLSYSLFYQIGWNLLEGATHTSMVIVTASATLYALLRAAKDEGRLAYCLLALAIGAGLLSKFSYPVFLAILSLTILVTPSFKSRLNGFYLMLAFMAGLVIALPYFLEIFSREGAAGLLFQRMDLIGDEKGVLRALIEGPKTVLVVFALYGLALVPVFALLFPHCLSWRRLWYAEREEQQEAVLAGFCFRAFVLSVALLFLGTLILGVDNIKERHLHPFFLSLPIALFAALARGPINEARQAQLRTIILLAALAILAVRFITLAFPYHEICGRCRENVPYAALANHLKAQDQNNDGTVVAMDIYTAANLKRFLPEPASIVTSAGPVRPARKCLLIWQQDTPVEGFSTRPLKVDWPVFWSDKPVRSTIWQFAMIEGEKETQAACPPRKDGSW